MIHSWGETTFEDFGLKSFRHDNWKKSDSQSCSATPRVGITVMSAGRGMVAVVRENGKDAIYLSVEDSRRNTPKRKTVTLKNEKIHTLSCGAAHSVLVSKTGKIYQLINQENSSVPRTLGLNDKQVIQVTCGDNHSIALTKDGQVFSWGQNSSGQLGLGHGNPMALSPHPVLALSGIPLAQISAGGDHSFALSLSGTVFGWGRNSAGQLGLGNTEDRYFPNPVKCLHSKKTVQIACGEGHTATLTKGGVVFTFGSGCYGQLGHNSNRDELRPRLVAELWGSRVSQIACGRHHTLAYAPSLKTVFTFGRGVQGPLGHRLVVDQYVPLPFHLHSDCDHTIDKIIAGGNQSFAFCSPAQEHKVTFDSPPNLSTMIYTIEERIISKWISGSDPKEWKHVKREITKMFSSASCLNGSFLNQSCDKHYQTVHTDSGLDMHLARLSFEKLAKSERVLKQILSVVLGKLMPSLNPNAVTVEGLRVYLILPELMRVAPTPQCCRDLSVAFANAVLNLHPIWYSVLGCLWSKLPVAFFKTLVKIFHSVSSRCLHQMKTVFSDQSDTALKTVAVLQMLYEINYKTGRMIEDSNFYIREINLFIQTIGKVHSENQIKNIQFLFQLIQYPCIFDMEMKQYMFRLCNMKLLMTNSISCPFGENSIYVNRRSLLIDTIQALQVHSRNYHWPLKVKFEEEDGIDHGGVSQDFFSMLAKDLLSLQPGVFEFYDDSRLVWFIQERHSDQDMYLLLGVLCGMALYNFCIMNLHFPLALFKKLLGFRPTLEDLQELCPVEARCLQDVLEEEEDFVEELYLDFTTKGHELVPHGRDIAVTHLNRKQYVDAYVDFVFNVSVKSQFADFARGFSLGCPNTKWKIFLPEELMAILNGNVSYEWEELQNNAKYIAYKPTDKNIQNFWTVFKELSEQQKKNFLSYMTGSERLPVGGLSKLQIQIMKQEKADPDEYYPVANTCYRILVLPNYTSIHILREKLHHAITFYEEFGVF